MGWTEIPYDILVDIANRLDLYKDYRNCREVCKAWKHALPRIPRAQKLCQTPWTVFPHYRGEKEIFYLYNLSEKKSYDINIPGRKFLCGSSFEWLAIQEDLKLYLLNIFTGINIIDLPTLGSLHDETDPHNEGYRLGDYILPYSEGQKDHVFTVILRPHDDFMVVVVYSSFQELAYSRRGEKTWTKIPMPFKWIIDATFHQGSLYAINYIGGLGVVNNMMGSSPRGIEIHVEKPPDPQGYDVEEHRLVSSKHDLLLVEISGKAADNTERGSKTLFRIFKLDGNMVNNLGDQVLLLGDHSSILVSRHIFPDGKGNCIYYHDYVGTYAGRIDCCFHLEDTSIKKHVCVLNKKRKRDKYRTDYPSMWFLSDLSADHHHQLS